MHCIVYDRMCLHNNNYGLMICSFRTCLGPIVGGALMYKVGFQSTTAVRHFSLAKLTLSQFDQSKNLMCHG